MANSNADLGRQLAAQGAKSGPLALQGSLDKWREIHGEKLVALAGDREKADRVFVVCMNTISRNPALLECTFESIASCILQSFQLNLFPGPFQECAYVPLNNSRTGKKECNFWPQYQGIVKLMRNAGNKAIVARVVFENDFFQYREGTDGPIYAPAVVLGKKRGKPLFTYAAILTSEDMWQVEVMDNDQIAVIKSRSRGATKADSPWNSKYEDDQYAMWAKTALKRASKWCTKSAELIAAIEADNEVDGDPALMRAKIIDLHKGQSAIEGGENSPALGAPSQGETVDLQTGEVVETNIGGKAS